MTAMAGPPAKRQTSEAFWASNLRHQDPALFNYRSTLDSPDNAHYNGALSELGIPSYFTDRASTSQSSGRIVRKRGFDENEQVAERSDTLQPSVQRDDSNEWMNAFPEFQPTLPSAGSRNLQVVISLPNPFEENAQSRYPTARTQKFTPQGAVNSYVKFRIVSDNGGSATQISMHTHQNLQYAKRHRTAGSRPPGLRHQPAAPRAIPNGFGRQNRLDGLDQKLWDFYISAMCSGRTLLPNTNGWLNDLAPMADNNKGVLHALLAFTAGYAMDYSPGQVLNKRGNHHYRTACEMLSVELNNPTNYEIGYEDTLVGMLRLLWCDDIVQWELRRDKDRLPRWFEAAQLAKAIMGHTDPGHRYWRVSHVQCSSARTSNANMLAFIDILSQPCRPLNMKDTENCHPWLLEGTEEESRRIYGGTGVCPKLLHMFGQITHLCCRVKEDPSSTMIPLGAKALERKLINFNQWSELSRGHASPEALLQTCRLDEHGLVGTAVEVTELTGEAWVQTARIYLQCRFFRLPRNHPAVRQPLDILVKCIARLPCSGPLFTSQSPFFPIVLMCIVSTRDEDRQMGRHWFEEVVSRASARSSVPPIWRIIQETWNWIDSEMTDDPHVDEKLVGDRIDWWELLVERLYEREGMLSVA